MQMNPDSENPEPKRRFTGYWIPVEAVNDPKLRPIEKLLLAEIHALEGEDGEGCYASNAYLAGKMDLSQSGLANILVKLRKAGYLETVGFDGRKRWLKVIWQTGRLTLESKADLLNGVTTLTQPSKADLLNGVTIDTSIDTRETHNQEVVETSSESDLSRDELKERLSDLNEVLFGKKMPVAETRWPYEMLKWLDQAAPFSRENWDLITWAYRLPPNHRIFSNNGLRLRQTMRGLMEYLQSEPEKIRSARRRIGLDATLAEKKPPPDPETTREQAAACCRLFGEDAPVFRKWSDFAPQTREQIMREISAGNNTHEGSSKVEAHNATKEREEPRSPAEKNL